MQVCEKCGDRLGVLFFARIVSGLDKVCRRGSDEHRFRDVPQSLPTRK